MLSTSEGEKIVFKVENVRRGFWGAYVNNLIITNKAIIIEKHGILGNNKGTERIEYNKIKQAIQGKAQNDEEQLEVYTDEKTETFAIQSGDERELKVLVLAINDQMSSEGEYYDYEFYQRMLKPATAIVDAGEMAEEKNNGSLIKDSAKNIFITRSVARGLIKTGLEKIADKTKDEVSEGMDNFVKNGKLGMHKKKIRYTFEEQLEIERNKIKNPEGVKEEKVDSNTVNNNNNSINEQIEALRELKKLVDEGILTQEEFEKKKKEILG